MDPRAHEENFSTEEAYEAREVLQTKKRPLEPSYFQDLPVESMCMVQKKVKAEKGNSSKNNVSVKEESKALKTKSRKQKTKKQEEITDSEEETDVSTSKKTQRARISMTKNYKGVLSSGLIRFMLEADEQTDSGLYQCLINLILEKREQDWELGSLSIEDFFNKAMDYANEEIFGKVEKESKNGKQSCLFKVGSVASFKKVFYPSREDSKLIAVIKDIWRTMFVDYFFDSKYYYQFITKVCKAPQQGKLFLFMKVDEIQKTLKDPYYRPDFQYDHIPLLQRKEFPADAFIEFMELFVPMVAAEHLGTKKF